MNMLPFLCAEAFFVCEIGKNGTNFLHGTIIMPRTSRQIAPTELCDKCRKLFFTSEVTFEDALESTAYKRPVADQPGRNYLMNISFLNELKKQGGCRVCIGLLERITQ